MSTNTCPIVGIGASAGGLEALKALFKALPADSGAAFVVIQHLDPRHESLTAEILGRSTAMPAVQVSDGMAVAPDHVYVIPPNAYLTLNNHEFQLSEAVLRNGLRMPIDTFFWSLAEQHEERAIAIIVSGTGSDGALGLRAIKGNGGLVLAQTPETAQYDGMPCNAIATGLVDVVCAVEEMPSQLAGYLRHAYIKQANSTATVAKDLALPNDTGQLHAVLALLQTRTGHDFRTYKHGTLRRRITRRMGLHHIESMAGYVLFLKQQEGEAALLLKDLLIGVTAFYRNSEAFAALEKKVIAPLVASKSGAEPIRIWVPGCASGEEAYSIAMAVVEQLETAHKHCPLQVFASDIDETALADGRAGLYPENVAVHLPPQRLQRFFSKEDHGFRVNKTLRDTVTFAAQNLISDPPFSNIDLISCRNLLIYLNEEVQQKVLALFHYALRDNGYLFLGHSEAAAGQADMFEPVVKKWRIFRRIHSARPSNLEFPTGARKTHVTGPGIPQYGHTVEQARLNDVIQQQLLQEFAPAAVLINNKYQIVCFSGPTARYLEQPTGAPTQDLLSLARHELRAKLRIALRRCSEDQQRMNIHDVQMLRDGVRAKVKITLKPLKISRLSDPLMLVTFEDQPVKPVSRGEKKKVESGTEASLLQQMEDELHLTREDLQGNIEELEAANQELQAANEEIMSVNEELQSTNEELETSKEELQSMNEELTTVNSQYKDKVDELAKINDDLTNLLGSTDIATLFVDTELKIRRFTPTTDRLLNLISTDIGRPLTDIRPKFQDADLLEDVNRVLEKLSPLEREVTSTDGDSYLQRILPYRTGDNRIAGAVITFIDINERKRSEEQNQLLAAVTRDSNDAITVQNLDGKITGWNRGAQRMYGWSEQEALSLNSKDLVPVAQRAHAQDCIQSIVRGDGAQSCETQRLTRDGRILDVWLTATALTDQAGGVTAVAATERDITERKRAEDALRAAKTVADSALTAKSRFLATASHDLRQPLQSLKLLNHALLNSIDDPKAQKMLAMQEESLDGMARLLNSLLDISKLDASTIAPVISDFSIRSVFERLGNEHGGLAREKGLEFRVNAGDDIARSDPGLLMQLLQNLIANAIRYTEHGFVELACTPEAEGLRIEVRDSGIGIPADQLPHIFDEFLQVNRPPQELHGGLGLGLAIVKRIAALLGTRVNVASRVGQGSTFAFTIPLSTAKAPDAKTPDIDNNHRPIKDGVVLFIDDDLAVLDAALLVLAMEQGFEVTTAASAAEAFEALDAIVPDLIITDFHLGNGETGIDIIRSARQRAGRAIPAILLTGDTSTEMDELQTGEVMYLTKPIDAKKLIAASRRLLAEVAAKPADVTN